MQVVKKVAEMDQNDVEYVCPFCAVTITGEVPPSCKMCGNSFRDLDLAQVHDGETLLQGLEKVTQVTRQQMEQIKNRKNWWKDDHGTKQHPQTNVKWENPFQTNYQRENDMSVGKSSSIHDSAYLFRFCSSIEIETFAVLANLSKFNRSVT